MLEKNADGKTLQISRDLLKSLEERRMNESPQLTERIYIEDILWKYANGKLVRHEEHLALIDDYFERIRNLKPGEVHQIAEGLKKISIRKISADPTLKGRQVHQDPAR